MKYKVLLVDDEPSIREGLRTLLDWGMLGYQVMDTAANAREALAKFEGVQPDLIIVDIRMPGMSGLELVEKLREQYDEFHVLVLSGYADFDYARKAIVNQVDGYLLKPVDEEELAAHLTTLKGRLDLEQSRVGSIAHTRTPEEIILAVLQGGMEGDEPLPVPESLLWSGYEAVLIQLQDRGGPDPDSVMQVKRLLTESLEQRGRGVVFALGPHLGIMAKENGGARQASLQVYQEIITAACAQAGVDFTAVSGGVVPSLGDLTLAVNRASELLQDKFYYAKGTIISESCFRQGSRSSMLEDNGFKSGALWVDRLYLAVDLGNLEAVDGRTQQLFEELRTGGLREQDFKTALVHIITSVLAKLAQHRPQFQEQLTGLTARLMEAHVHYRFDDLRLFIRDLLRSAAAVLDTADPERHIAKMVDLIHRNYQENLKLETLAEVFNYNSAYLGKLFKSATGEYFNTYVDKVRIDRAKELLEQGMKVYQVAENVGYTHVDYFHSKFKKYEGRSPSAYRKK
ncbi:response regulator [Paenibacillus gansuensis]|uniref:Response regulator n=1 Tax=Paenibacillus gansuensis TaxID=306542 RepID=A0ABW5P8A0_9BACL